MANSWKRLCSIGSISTSWFHSSDLSADDTGMKLKSVLQLCRIYLSSDQTMGQRTQ
jgi:hypothetical protein